MRTTLARLGVLCVTVVLLAGCNPITWQPSGGGAGTGSCLPGTWTLDTEQIASPITTPIGDITLSTSGAGTTLTFTDTDWSLHTDTTLNASLTTQFGTVNGTIMLQGDANGTYTADGTDLTFTLASVSGTVAYDVNVFGYHLAGTLSLPSSGLEDLVGLHGTAKYTCTSDSLAFTLAPLSVDAHH